MTQYLTEDATRRTLGEVAGLAPGTELVMEYTAPLALLDGEERE